MMPPEKGCLGLGKDSSCIGWCGVRMSVGRMACLDGKKRREACRIPRFRNCGILTGNPGGGGRGRARRRCGCGCGFVWVCMGVCELEERGGGGGMWDVGRGMLGCWDVGCGMDDGGGREQGVLKVWICFWREKASGGTGGESPMLWPMIPVRDLRRVGVSYIRTKPRSAGLWLVGKGNV